MLEVITPFLMYYHDLYILVSLFIFYFYTMDLAENIKIIREKKRLLQKEIALHIGANKSKYSKI